MAGHISQSQADEYAIGALEPEIERLITLHASECEECRERLFAADRAAAYLAASAPRVAAPKAMKERVFIRAGIRKPSPIVRAMRYARATAAVAAAIVAVAAFTGMVTLRSELNAIRHDNDQMQIKVQELDSRDVQIYALSQGLKEAEATAEDLRVAADRDNELLAALLSPESDIADVSPLGQGNSSIGRLVWEADQSRIWFVAQKLPHLPEGQTYQLWLISDGDYVSIGTFNSEDDGAVIYPKFVPEGLGRYDSALVTIETIGGGSERRGDGIFFVADLARTSQ